MNQIALHLRHGKLHPLPEIKGTKTCMKVRSKAKCSPSSMLLDESSFPIASSSSLGSLHDELSESMAGAKATKQNRIRDRIMVFMLCTDDFIIATFS